MFWDQEWTISLVIEFIQGYSWRSVMQPDSRKRYKVAKSVKHVRNLCIHTDTPCERPPLQESIGSSDAAEDRSVMRVMPSADNCEKQRQRQRRRWRHSLQALQGTGWGETLNSHSSFYVLILSWASLPSSEIVIKLLPYLTRHLGPNPLTRTPRLADVSNLGLKNREKFGRGEINRQQC